MQTEFVIFVFLALATLIGAASVALSRNIFWSAMGLLSSLVGVGGLYVLLSADFIAITQVLVYIGGVLVLAGLLTRFAAFPLLINISVAILSTKIPVLLGHGFWTFTLAKLPRYGFLSMMHEARTDFSMLLGLLFLLIVGAGAWSVDAVLARGMMNHEPAKTNAPTIGG